MSELTAGMHDRTDIYPTLPPREPDDVDRKIHGSYPEGDPWQACWEYVLTHRLTPEERAAFWRGAHLAQRAFA